MSILAVGLMAPSAASATGYVFVTNYTAGTVAPFSIGVGGGLSQLGTGVASGTGATDTVVDDAVSMDGKYLFVPNGGQGTVSTFSIAADGTLSEQGTPVVSGTGATGNPEDVAVDPCSFRTNTSAPYRRSRSGPTAPRPSTAPA
jgi:6-phosphogluconolactonase (cycloisomerase 2 family)